MPDDGIDKQAVRTPNPTNQILINKQNINDGTDGCFEEQKSLCSSHGSRSLFLLRIVCEALNAQRLDGMRGRRIGPSQKTNTAVHIV
jgi:hypothetical protein